MSDDTSLPKPGSTKTETGQKKNLFTGNVHYIYIRNVVQFNNFQH